MGFASRPFDFVIASEPKQSRAAHTTLDCFVAEAPRNDQGLNPLADQHGNRAIKTSRPTPSRVPSPPQSHHSRDRPMYARQ